MLCTDCIYRGKVPRTEEAVGYKKVHGLWHWTDLTLNLAIWEILEKLFNSDSVSSSTKLVLHTIRCSTESSTLLSNSRNSKYNFCTQCSNLWWSDLSVRFLKDIHRHKYFQIITRVILKLCSVRTGNIYPGKENT